MEDELVLAATSKEQIINDFADVINKMDVPENRGIVLIGTLKVSYYTSFYVSNSEYDPSKVA